jgi:hypothetical protein
MPKWIFGQRRNDDAIHDDSQGRPELYRVLGESYECTLEVRPMFGHWGPTAADRHGVDLEYAKA